MKKYFNKKNIIMFGILFAISFFICMLSPLDIFTKNAPTFVDSSVFKYIGNAMKYGIVPYRDTFDHKGLLIYIINYLGSLISEHRGVWFIQLFLMNIAIFSAYKLARKFISRKSAIFVILIAFAPIYVYYEGGNLTEDYAMTFIMISLNTFVDFFINPNKYCDNSNNSKLNYKWFNIPVCLNGLCLGCVLFLRPNMIAIWIVFVTLITIYCIKNKKISSLFKFIISFLIGLAIITIPMLTYLIVNNALNDFIKDYAIFNFLYSSQEERVTVKGKADTFKYFFTHIVMLMSVIILTGKIYMQKKKNEKYGYNLAYLICMILQICLLSLSGMTYKHYGMTLLPLYIYPLCILFKYIENYASKDAKLVVIVYLLLVYIIPPWTDIALNTYKDILEGLNYNKNEIINLNAHTKDEIEKSSQFNNFIEYIQKNTTENDCITIFGNENYIYNFAHRKSASKYSYQHPIINLDVNIENEYFSDLNTTKPKIIIWQRIAIFNSCIDERMNNFIKENNYELIMSAGGFDLYQMLK